MNWWSRREDLPHMYGVGGEKRVRKVKRRVKDELVGQEGRLTTWREATETQEFLD